MSENRTKAKLLLEKKVDNFKYYSSNYSIISKSYIQVQYCRKLIFMIFKQIVAILSVDIRSEVTLSNQYCHVKL